MDSQRSENKLTIGQATGLDDSAAQSLAARTRAAFSRSNKITAHDLIIAKHSLKKPEDFAYITSPHDDTRNLFSNALGISTHRLKESRFALHPVFKDDAQRQSFHAQASTALSEIRSKQADSSAYQSYSGYSRTKQDRHMAALSQLAEYSKPKVGHTSFQYARERMPEVTVQGHGSPGKNYISSDAPNSRRDSATVANMLMGDMQMPATSRVRANSCWSAVGTQYLGYSEDLRSGNRDWMDRFDQGTLGAVQNPQGGFANRLLSALRSHARSFTGTVTGFLGPTTQASVSDARERGGRRGSFMGVGMRVEVPKVTGTSASTGDVFWQHQSIAAPETKKWVAKGGPSPDGFKLPTKTVSKEFVRKDHAQVTFGGPPP